MHTHRTAVITALSCALLVLTGCGTTIEPTRPQTTQDDRSQNTSRVTIEHLLGQAEPDDISVLCVDGSAFLYVIRDGEYLSAGPALARFPEQDKTCGGDSDATTRDTEGGR